MAFHAELILDGQKFKVLSCEYQFEQDIDEFHHKPDTKPMGGTMSITIEAQSGDGIILSWMLSNTMTKNGNVLFYKDNSKTVIKTVLFSTAYCIQYTERFEHDDEENLRVSFTITAKNISINGITHKNTW